MPAADKIVPPPDASTPGQSTEPASRRVRGRRGERRASRAVSRLGAPLSRRQPAQMCRLWQTHNRLLNSLLDM